ncbi:hypothetical protein BIY23_01630 [Wolbachia pipientis]|uniref:Alpha/beta hydrolase n=1 Tax=Wolbachia pipientis TaxID=955 RepID=A0A1E7QL06_WOLPI|nr:hypothetical protein [Wolbachia pipientis]OEY87160.1 hypothetical protein BIY23_01630 [Wolbachia pipientis]
MSDIKLHVVFFDGLGSNHKETKKYMEYFCEALYQYRKELDSKQMHDIQIIGHAHKYPKAFQNYNLYLIVSFVLLGMSIVSPLMLYFIPITLIPLSFISLSCISLSCLLLSIVLIMIPFIHKKQDLYISSIQEIEQLIESGVKPEQITLFGHSFGGAVILKVMRYFADKDIKLGDAMFTSTFSSFEKAVKNYPIPQTKLLPSFLLKIFNLDFNPSDDIKSLYSENKLIPIVIINHTNDTLIPRHIQLSTVTRKLSYNSSIIKIPYVEQDSTYCHYNNYHNDILFNRCLLQAFPSSYFDNIKYMEHTDLESVMPADF